MQSNTNHRMAEVFTFSRDDFNEKCQKAYKDLWLDTDLADVTLAAEDGGLLRAHKVLLASCSPLFRRLLQKNPNEHPMLYLMGVQSAQLEQVLSFIYLGKCDLAQDQLPALMATGKLLQVDGLSEDFEEIENPLALVGLNMKRSDSVEQGSKDVQLRDHKFNEEFLEVIENNSIVCNFHSGEDGISEIQVPQLRNQKEPRYDDNYAIKKTYQEEALARNIKNSSEDLACDQCDYDAGSFANLRQHKQNVHEGLKYDCTSCDFKTGDKGNLKKHVQKDHLGVTYTCSICKQVFNYKQNLNNHVNIKHNGLVFNCTLCPYHATTKAILNNHILVQHEGKTFDCKTCQSKFNSKKNLDCHIKRRHVRSVRREEKFSCDVCGKMYSGPKNVTIHKQTVHFKATVYGAKTLTETIFSMVEELGSGWWKCMQCGKESQLKKVLKMHIESDHMGITHTCGMCGHTFRRRDTFNAHLQTSACNVKKTVFDK